MKDHAAKGSTKKPGFWNFDENTASARAKYATSQVNLISPCARAIKEMDEKKIREGRD